MNSAAFSYSPKLNIGGSLEVIGGNHWVIFDYRHSFNGMEKDDEIKGDNNSYDFGARIYDPRIGKFLSTDPKEFIYPWQSSYVFAANNPIKLIDIHGENPGEPGQKEEKFKKNVLVVKTQEEYDMYVADPKNKNWKIIFATSLQDAQQQMGAYLEKHGEKQFNNIVIRSHGKLGYPNSAVNDSQTGQSVSKSGGLAIGLDDDYTDKGPLGPNLNVNAGLLMADHVKKDYTTSGGASAAIETVQALKIIGTYAKNSVVFTGCLAAYGPDNIIQAISGLPEYQGVKVYGNTDKSSVLPFNTELTDEENYSGGFRLYVDGVLQEEHIGLIMSTLDNYPIYTYNKKGKRKAA